MSSGNRLENHIRAYLGVPVRTAPSGCSPFQPLRGPPSLRQAQGPRRRLPSLTLRHVRIKRFQDTALKSLKKPKQVLNFVAKLQLGICTLDIGAKVLAIGNGASVGLFPAINLYYFDMLETYVI